MKRQLIFQFYGESILFAVLSLILGIAAAGLLLPTFNTLSGKELSIDSGILIVCLVAITLFTGLVAGSYPALFLSSIRPIAVLKGAVKATPKNALCRKTLVVIQFALSIF